MEEHDGVKRQYLLGFFIAWRSTGIPGLSEFLSDLLNELNWNYIVNDILNEAAEAGYFKDGETQLLKDEASS
jgi:hypothetical protein